MAKNKNQKTYKPVLRIEVFIWNKFVGAVALDPRLQFYVFAYDPEFAKTGIELAPLHMPLREAANPFVFTDLPELTYKRLPALLADALPDDFGNALIDRYMAEYGISKSNITALDRLAYMGSRAMGALEFKPVRGLKSQTSTAIELNELVTIARKAVKGKITNDTEANQALRELIDVGTSAGGARAKAVIAWNPQTNEVRSGQVPTDPGFEHWLLKFDGMGADRELGASQNYGRIEYAYALMAKACGIQMQDCRLFEENGRAHFMTKRFDRAEGNVKHHTQTLCAMNHLDFKKKSTNSYEQVFMTMRDLGLDHKSDAEMFRRMVFNFMAQNCDDHTKNISFLLRPENSWELAPAYDVTFAYNPKGEWTHQHLMSVNGKFKDVTLKDFLILADRFGIGEAKSIFKDIQSAVKSWPRFAKKAGLHLVDSKKIQNFHNA